MGGTGSKANQLKIVIGILWCILNACYVLGGPADGYNICWGGRRICPEDQVCVTWERTCSGTTVNDPNCRHSFGNPLLSECVPSDEYSESVQNHSLKPKSKNYCPPKSIFILGSVRQCFAPPCPPYWTYHCYKKTDSTLTCATIKVREGYVCTMGLKCDDGPCRPVPKIIYVGNINKQHTQF